MGALPAVAQPAINWVHISSKNGGIEAPNTGNEQTASVVADFDNDGINDFAISERTAAPALVWYRRNKTGWDRLIVEAEALHIEAGMTSCDVDGDGDQDIIAAGDWMRNEVWWWENPLPNFDHAWKRYVIRNSGANKSHDQLTGDFDGDGKTDLVFWAQGDHTLYFTRIPDNPKDSGPWKLIPVYTYSTDGQMEQRGESPSFRGTNEHEGLAKIDIDADGIEDIIGGGLWFRYLGDDRFAANEVDASYPFSRCAAGQLIDGGRPEIVLVIGDGRGPLMLYEFTKTGNTNTWIAKTIVPEVSNGHTLAVVDFDGDGHADIWSAEMTLNNHTTAVNHILLGDGRGNFLREVIISTGIDLHESEIADLDGDGDLDVLGKPYTGDAPRLDIWLQNGTAH